MRIETRVQPRPECGIDGIGKTFIVGRPFARHARYVVVTVDGVPVGQQAVLMDGGYWRVNDFFVAPAFRGTEASRALRKATYCEIAKETDAFRAWITYAVAPVERVLDDPLRRQLGVEVVVLLRHEASALYEFRNVKRAAAMVRQGP